MKLNLKSTTPTQKIEPNVYGKEILRCFEEDPTNMVIMGVPGCGKTTVLRMCANRIPRNKTAVLVCFNSATAEHAKRVMPFNVHVSTTHTLGFNVIKSHYRNLMFKVNGRKVENYLKYQILGEGKKKQLDSDKFHFLVTEGKEVIVPLMDFLRQTNSGLSLVQPIAEEFKLDFGEPHRQTVIELWQYLTQEPAKKYNTVDFADMLWMPIYFEMTFPQYNYVLVDEYQDFNPAQIEMVKRLCAVGGKVVVVGDHNQSIYGWRGADTRAMQDAPSVFNAQVKPLSICYRCGEGIIQEAQKHIPNIEGTGKPGTVHEVTDLSLAREGDMVICRLVAPLIPEALKMFKLGKRVKIFDQDVSKWVLSYAKEVEKRHGTIDSQSIFQYTETEITKAKQKRQLNKVNFLQDKRDILLGFVQESQFIELKELKHYIEELFINEEEEGILFSTIHRVKGMEARNVFLLNPDLIPYKRAETEKEIEQEYNLLKVAITRAIEKLYYVRRTPE